VTVLTAMPDLPAILPLLLMPPAKVASVWRRMPL
jgi:hypothetical protein